MFDVMNNSPLSCQRRQLYPHRKREILRRLSQNKIIKISASICAIREQKRHLRKSAKSARYKNTMNENDISYDIRGAIFKVYNQLGQGLLVNFNTAEIEKNIIRIVNNL